MPDGANRNPLHVGIYIPTSNTNTVPVRAVPLTRGNLSLNESSPTGSTTAELPNYEQLKFTTLSPGGDGTATFVYTLPFPYRGKEDIRINSRVEIYDTSGLVWRGRIQQLKRDDQAGSIIYTITANGYASSLQDFGVSMSFNRGLTVDGAVKQLLQDQSAIPINVSPWQIDITNFSFIEEAGQTMYGGMNAFQGKTPQWVLAELCKFGDKNNTPLYWHVWEGSPGTTSKPPLELISKPSTPTYMVSLADGAHPQLTQDITRVWNVIGVAYNYVETTNQMLDAAEIKYYYNLNSIEQLGFWRQTYIMAQRSPGDNQTALLDIQNIAQTALNNYSYPRWIGQSISIPETVPIQSATQGEVPPWRVKAGRNCQIREYVAGPGAETLEDNKMFYIAKTEWDNDNRTLTVTPEAAQTVETMIGRFLADQRYS